MRRRVRKPGLHAHGRAEIDEAVEAIGRDEAERMRMIVVGGERASVRVGLGLPPRVGRPSRQAIGRGRGLTRDIEIDAVRAARAEVRREAGDQRRTRHAPREIGREFVGRGARGRFLRRFETAQQKTIEPLVIAFHARDQSSGHAALERDQSMPRLLASQADGVGVGEIDEVVGLQQLLVAGTLREQTRRPREGDNRAPRSTTAARRGEAITSSARPLESTRIPSSACTRRVMVHLSVSHAPARHVDRFESSSDGSPAPTSALDPFGVSLLRSPVIRQVQSVRSEWPSMPNSSRCAECACTTVSFRIATSRMPRLRVKMMSSS